MSEKEEEQSFRLEDWYNPTDAASRLSANSGKEIDVSYVRTLARYGKIRSYPLSKRIRLYNKADVNEYIVEERGEKSGRAKRTAAQNRNKVSSKVDAR